MASKAIDVGHANTGDRLFVQIGAFLATHRLSPLPEHYTFAHAIVADPGGPLAHRVAQLTDGGIRLSAHDIQMLGDGRIRRAMGRFASGTRASPVTEEMAELLLAQIEGFTATVRAAHLEANGFGRDLMRSAETLREAGLEGIEEITRLTDVMIERVHQAETRLEQARRETEELREALDEARGSARTDPLTELPNRRAFDEAFADLPGECTVSVAICDIDHFKRVNDSFGHAVGDRVIRAVAQTLAKQCGCLVARYGGEEFALLFDDLGLEEAIARIEKARMDITNRRLRVRETGVPIGVVTFSSGVAEGPASEGRAAMMARADAALYLAKNQGRACTITAP